MSVMTIREDQKVLSIRDSIHKDDFLDVYFRRLEGNYNERKKDDLRFVLERLPLYIASHNINTGFLVEYVVNEMPDLLERYLTASDLGVIGTLHDLGKYCIDEGIRDRKGPLEEQQKNTVKLHPNMGAYFMKEIGFRKKVSDAVNHHHERWDGKGYPDGLAGEKIPLGSRIMRPLDSLEKYVGFRPYKKSIPMKKALKRILDDEGKRYDPEIVENMIPLLMKADLGEILYFGFG